MPHFEDTTTQQGDEDKDDELVILDGASRQELFDEPGANQPEKNKLTLLERLRKLM